MTDKRSFDKLSDVEKDAMRKLYEAERAMVSLTFDSTCALARKLSGDSTLRATDEGAQVYTQLRIEGWIVVRHHDQSARMLRFGVSDDYKQLQLA